MKIYLHIGMEKTGTTSIQAYMNEKRLSLLEKKVLYPSSLSLPNNHFITAAFQNMEKQSDLRAMYGVVTNEDKVEFHNDVKEAFRAEVEQFNPESIIISSEHLSSRLNDKSEVESVIRFLRQFTDEIYVLVYLRRQDSFLESLFSTAIISGNTHTLDEYYQRMKHRHDLDFEALLRMWEECVGEANMRVGVFEKECLVKQDIIADFLTQIGLDADQDSKVKMNRSLGAKRVELLRRFNLRYPLQIENNPNPKRKGIMRLLWESPCEDRAIKLSNAQKSQLQGMYREKNSRVAKKYFGKEYLFPDDEWKNDREEETNLEVDDLFCFFCFLWEKGLNKIFT